MSELLIENDLNPQTSPSRVVFEAREDVCTCMFVFKMRETDYSEWKCHAVNYFRTRVPGRRNRSSHGNGCMGAHSEYGPAEGV